MVISKDSTACTVKRFLTPTCSLISAKSESSPKNGSKTTTYEDRMKHYRTEYSPNGNNEFNLNLTIKLFRKIGYLQLDNEIGRFCLKICYICSLVFYYSHLCYMAKIFELEPYKLTIDNLRIRIFYFLD
jgi:hypothetical protein